MRNLDATDDLDEGGDWTDAAQDVGNLVPLDVIQPLLQNVDEQTIRTQNTVSEICGDEEETL